jgi:hypothetical protein
VALDEHGKWRHAPDEPFEGLQLADGWGSSSIRGKVYAEVIEAATGHSLYQDHIEPPTVLEMATRLRVAVEQAKGTGSRTGVREVPVVDDKGVRTIRRIEFPLLLVSGSEVHAGEAEDLARWFEICAEHGYAIEGWW